MPNLEAKHIPVWITQCEPFHVAGEADLSTKEDENCILQLGANRCRVQYREKAFFLPPRSLMMLGRETSIRLRGEPGQSCDLTLLRYAHTYTHPRLDLNHLCLRISLVDSFLGRKERFCVLSDREYIYLTLNALCAEWRGAEQEKDMMIYALLQELFIKLARSFHTHNQANGISYLTKARAFIQQHYHEALSLADVAAAAGISRSYLTLLFQRYMHRSVVDYIQAVRCDHAAFLLSTTRFPAIDIALESGFTNRQHFARTFAKVYGIAPHAYRKAHGAQAPAPGRP